MVVTELANASLIAIANLNSIGGIVEAALAGCGNVAIAKLFSDGVVEGTVLENTDQVSCASLATTGGIAEAELINENIVGQYRGGKAGDEYDCCCDKGKAFHDLSPERLVWFDLLQNRLIAFR